MALVPPTPDEWLVAVAAAAEDGQPVPVVLLLAAHPDDEVIGVGTRLPRLAPKLTVAHVTDGNPKDDQDAKRYGFASRTDYAAARRCELDAALALCGGAATREIGIGDQEASLRLVELTHYVANLLRTIRPDVLITHPYEGGHPDHDATAFAAQAAVGLLEHDGFTPPIRVEMTSYHNGPEGLISGAFLPVDNLPVVMLALSPDEQAFKRKLFACFVTQQGTLQYFRTDVEGFRLAPTYDFTRPPHMGTLFYEQFDWGMTGHQFRSRAADALWQLGLAGSP